MIFCKQYPETVKLSSQSRLRLLNEMNAIWVTHASDCVKRTLDNLENSHEMCNCKTPYDNLLQGYLTINKYCLILNFNELWNGFFHVSIAIVHLRFLRSLGIRYVGSRLPKVKYRLYI